MTPRDGHQPPEGWEFPYESPGESDWGSVGFTLYLGRALRQREQKDVEHLIEPWYVVHDGMETDVICGMLRQEGIKRFHRSLTEAGSTWSMGTRTEVLVDDANLDRARELLASSDSEEGDDD